MAHPPPILLLDRDGVINRDRPNYVLGVDQLEILPGIPQAVARLNQAGVRVVVITNQGCIAKGLLREEELAVIHGEIQARLQAAGGLVSAFYYCPHHDADGCACRKPQPGMLLQAQQDWGFSPARTWMVGDSDRDIKAARAAGCLPALVLSGHGDPPLAQQLQVPAFEDLNAFVHAYLDANHPLFGPLWLS